MLAVSIMLHTHGMNIKDRLWHLISKKLANEASTEELAELEELLRSDPEMHYALQHINDLWSLPIRPDAEGEDAFARHQARLLDADTDWQPAAEQEAVIESDPFPPARSNRRKWMIAGSITTVLIAVSYLLFLRPNIKSAVTEKLPASATKNEVTTRNGSRTKISLPDGSQVWMNAGSNLVYDKEFGNGLREVQLSGEAFFDVVKNADIPFIIHTKQVDIRVVGTAFNVRSYPSERQTETSLVRGSVEVTIHDRPAEKIMLQPNEKLLVTDSEMRQGDSVAASKEKNEPIFSVGKLTYTKADSIVVETAWVEDKLVFDNEPFREVSEKMERWYNVKFEFRDSATKQLHFTGIFQNETIQQALEAMKITAGNNFRYSIEGNKITISKK